jgi:Amidase
MTITIDPFTLGQGGTAGVGPFSLGSDGGGSVRIPASFIARHAFVQDVRRRHYELAVEELTNQRLAVAFDELAEAI